MDIRSLYLPDFAPYRRIKMLKNLIALATLSSLLVSWKLWIGERLFPRIPAFDALPVLNNAIEIFIYGAMLLSCVFIFLSRKPRVFILTLLLLASAMCLADVNRLQPWVYLYALLFFVMLFYNWRVDEPRDYTPVFSTIRLTIIAFFIWDGFHKMNYSYIHETWPWMLHPFESVISHKALSLLSKSAFVLPAIEILAAVSLFFPTLKRIGIPTLFLLNIINLVCLGPFGNNFNPVLWPWNICMIIMVYIVFAGRAESRYYHLYHTLQFKPLYLVLFCAIILPAINFNSRLNTRGLTNFTPGQINGVSVELSDEAAGKLPLYISSFVSHREGKILLNVNRWAMFELSSPINASSLIYYRIVEEVKKITCCPHDVNLRFKENSSQVAAL